MTPLSWEEQTNYPLVLTVDDLGDAIALTAQVSESVDPRRICGLMQRALEELVRALQEGSDCALRSLDVLPRPSEAGYARMRSDGSEVSSEQCIHEMFEETAGHMPTAVAVRCAEETLSYAELNARANQLARHLREQGVGPDSRVGICVSAVSRWWWGFWGS